MHTELDRPRSISNLLAQAANDRTFPSDRRIALYQTIEKLAEFEDRSETHLTNNLQVAEEAVRLISTRLPDTKENFILLDRAIDQIIKRLPPDQVYLRSSDEIELSAAETAAKCAWRYQRNPGKVIEPLQELLQSPPISSAQSAMRFADAGATLLVCLSQFGDIPDLSFVIAKSLLEAPQIPASNQAKRIASIFSHAAEFSQQDHEQLVTMFNQSIDEMARTDLGGTENFIVAQKHRFEEAYRPELIADIIIPAEMSLRMKRQRSVFGPKQQLLLENSLHFTLSKVASQADIGFG